MKTILDDFFIRLTSEKNFLNVAPYSTLRKFFSHPAAINFHTCRSIFKKRYLQTLVACKNKNKNFNVIED